MPLELLPPDPVGPSSFSCLSLCADASPLGRGSMIPYLSVWPVRHCLTGPCLPSQPHDEIPPLPCLSPPSITILSSGAHPAEFNTAPLSLPAHSSLLPPLYLCCHAPLFLVPMAASCEVGNSLQRVKETHLGHSALPPAWAWHRAGAQKCWIQRVVD